jgi:hypothetical protein
MAWITTHDSIRRDERGQLVKRYRVEWYEIAREGDSQPVLKCPNRPDGPPKLL